MGGQSVNPGSYITQREYDVETAALQGKMSAENMNFQLAVMGFEQQSKSQERALKLAAQLQPNFQNFNASETSKEAAEFGLANLARSREFEKITDPVAAEMRRGISKRVEEATSKDTWKKQMEEWAKTKGLMSILPSRDGMSGIDPDSTIARSAFFDRATQAGREFELGNLAAQQGFLSANAAPMGGIDPGALMEAKQASESTNLANLSGWQQNIINAARGMQLQSPVFVPTSGYQDIMGLQNAMAQDRQNYQQAMYQAAAQNAASGNQMTGSLIGAGGAIGGAALGAVII